MNLLLNIEMKKKNEFNDITRFENIFLYYYLLLLLFKRNELKCERGGEKSEKSKLG